VSSHYTPSTRIKKTSNYTRKKSLEEINGRNCVEEKRRGEGGYLCDAPRLLSAPHLNMTPSSRVERRKFPSRMCFSFFFFWRFLNGTASLGPSREFTVWLSAIEIIRALLSSWWLLKALTLMIKPSSSHVVLSLIFSQNLKRETEKYENEKR
jgi:hypothetical protein